MAKEENPIVHGTFKFEGNAAKIILEKKAERMLSGKSHATETVIKLLLCEQYNRKHNTQSDCS